MLSKETINELSEILKADYGQDLTPQEVFEVAQDFIGFSEHLIKLDSQSKNEHENIISRAKTDY